MSRIDTQSDRLVRGQQGLDQQRSFLVQPRAFQAASPGSQGLSSALGSLAKAVQTANKLKEEKEEERNATLEKARESTFTRTTTDLMKRRELFEATDPNDYDAHDEALNHYAKGLEEAEKFYANDPERTAYLQRYFGSIDAISIQEENIEEARKTASWGAFLEGAKGRVEEFRTTEAINYFGQMGTYAAQAEILEGLASSWDEDTLGEMPDSVLASLQDVALEFANESATERSKYLEEEENSVYNASVDGVVNALQGNGLFSEEGPPEVGQMSFGRISQIAAITNRPRDEFFLDVLERMSQSVINKVDMGNDVSQLASEVSTMRKFARMVGSEDAIEIVSEAVEQWAELSSKQDSHVLTSVGNARFASGGRPGEIRQELEQAAIEMFATRFELSIDEDAPLELIKGNNEIQIAYLDKVKKNIGSLFKDWEEKTGEFVELSNAFIGENKDPVKVSGLLNMDEPAKMRLVSIIKDRMNLAQWKADSLVADQAEWYEFIGDNVRNTAGWHGGFKTAVLDVIRKPEPTHAELRAAYAFAGGDMLALTPHIEDPEILYAYGEMVREAEAFWKVHTGEILSAEGPVLPPDFDFEAAFNRGLAEYRNVTIDGDDGEKGTPIERVFNDPDFIKEFAGNKDAQIPEELKRWFISIMDISTFSGDSPRAVALHLKKKAAAYGIYTDYTKDGRGGGLISFTTNPNSPEGVGLSKDLVIRGMSEGTSTANGAIGNMLSRTDASTNKSLHDLGIEVLQRNPAVLPEKYRDVLSPFKFQNLVNNDDIMFDILSSEGSATEGSPVVMRVLAPDGSYVTIPMGNLNFSELKMRSQMWGKNGWDRKKTRQELEREAEERRQAIQRASLFVRRY